VHTFLLQFGGFAMYSINMRRIAVGVVFASCALMAGATTNGANAKEWKDDAEGYRCHERYQCNDWRGGIYHRSEGGVNYYYGGGEELGYGNRPRKIHYKFQYVFQNDDDYEAPNYYQDY
jgi:hypothetical protein